MHQMLTVPMTINWDRKHIHCTFQNIYCDVIQLENMGAECQCQLSGTVKKSAIVTLVCSVNGRFETYCIPRVYSREQ